MAITIISPSKVTLCKTAELTQDQIFVGIEVYTKESLVSQEWETLPLIVAELSP